MVTDMEILVVDDEPMILSMLTGVLAGEGYRVTSAVSGADAIARLASNDHRIGLLVTDVNLGEGVDGLEVAAALHRRDSAIGTIFMTGDPPRQHRDRAPAGAVFLEKPFLPFELVDAVRRLRQPEAA
ncbi:response regulator [Sphingosinicella rhizophila]|uniref:Response regulator n=1 Tax=Sphingosinicella rhizophila TaxID=3050082 RepID=A0ABU3QAY3_9SPHN|nr:response regulator [Sphingosinicella sp. GR2756]MDT9600163.1 response regulator [Sphingosinicella sp. GR2756]